MIRLRLLGSLALAREDGSSVRSVLAQPKRFAVLAYLAASSASERPRDTLLGLFWPDMDEEHARKALRQSLYRLRRSLGPGVLTGKGAELVGVDRARLWCDAAAFSAAVDGGRDGEALELYRGPFLDGFHLSGAPGFERWVEGKRRGLRTDATAAAWTLAGTAEREDDRAEARHWGDRALELAPYDGEGIRRYIALMDRLGQPAAAVKAYEAYAERLDAELELRPSPETVAAVQRVRDRKLGRAGSSSGELEAVAAEYDGGEERKERVEHPKPALDRGQAPTRPRMAGRAGRTEPRVGRWTFRIAALAGMLLLVYTGLSVGGAGDPASGNVPRLAVLPFENLGASEHAYFVDGITDEITTRLSGLSGLAVIARQSAIQYEGTDKTPQQIGRELDAAYLLEATVSWESGPDGSSRVRIRPQLVRTSDGTSLWADVLDENLTEVFAVQTRIATRVVDALGIALRETERRSLAAVPTDDLEAHDFYLRGLAYTRAQEMWDERRTRLAIGLFERAVEQDPGFGPAHAALAQAHWRLYWYAWDPTAERLALMERSVDEALRLDPGLVEARMALARYHYARRDFDAALRELLPLRAQQPHNAELIALIAYTRRRQGRFEDAIGSLEEATGLGPRSAAWWFNLGETRWLVRSYAAAESALSVAYDLAPESYAVHAYRIQTRVCATGKTAGARRALADAERFGLGTHPRLVQEAVWLEVLDRRYPEALRRLREARGIEAFDSNQWYVPRNQWMGEMFRLMGRRDSARAYYERARRHLEAKAREAPNDFRYHTSLGIVYAGLGRREEALRAARRATEILPTSRDAYRGLYALEGLAYVYATIGEHEAAIAGLERLLDRPSHLSGPLLRIDPRWDPLRNHPRFRMLSLRNPPGGRPSTRSDLKPMFDAVPDHEGFQSPLRERTRSDGRRVEKGRTLGTVFPSSQFRTSGTEFLRQQTLTSGGRRLRHGTRRRSFPLRRSVPEDDIAFGREQPPWLPP